MPTYVYTVIAAEDRILTFAMDPANGKLEQGRDTSLPGGPSNVAVSPDRRFMYIGLRATPGLATLTINPASGALTPLGEPVALEADPCCIGIDHTGRYVLSAHYQGRHIGVHPVEDNGRVTSPPVEWIETLLGAHCVNVHRSNRFVFLPHVQQSNTIYQYHFDEATGRLTPNKIPKVDGYPGQGPRHYVYHPRLDVVYTSDEQGNSITAYRLDVDAGTLEPFQTLSTLPEGWDDQNSTAQIHITASGRFVYVANRGHDSLAGFAIDAGTGELTSLGQTPCEPVPRTFAIDPTDTFLYAAGQGSRQLAAYRVEDNGTLIRSGTYPLGDNPMWVQVVSL